MSDAGDLSALRAQMAENQDGVLEMIAEAHGVPTIEVVRHLPGHRRQFAEGTMIGDVLAEIAEWGEVLILIHTGSLVAEIMSEFPKANLGRGFYNFHGDTPFSGHLYENACTDIAFIERPFFGRPSLAVLLFDEAGMCIFKVFVRRGSDGELNSEQSARFVRLRERVCDQASA
ncbi:MAG: heme utilization cystosolic carrier protein HutX [Pseudomonadota bacterium]